MTCDNCQDCLSTRVRRLNKTIQVLCHKSSSSLSIIKKCVESGYKQPATKEYTSLKVTKKLTSKLKQLGTKGQTYEEINWKLIEKAE